MAVPIIAAECIEDGDSNNTPPQPFESSSSKRIRVATSAILASSQRTQPELQRDRDDQRDDGSPPSSENDGGSSSPPSIHPSSQRTQPELQRDRDDRRDDGSPIPPENDGGLSIQGFGSLVGVQEVAVMARLDLAEMPLDSQPGIQEKYSQDTLRLPIPEVSTSRTQTGVVHAENSASQGSNISIVEPAGSRRVLPVVTGGATSLLPDPQLRYPFKQSSVKLTRSGKVKMMPAALNTAAAFATPSNEPSGVLPKERQKEGQELAPKERTLEQMQAAALNSFPHPLVRKLLPY